MAALHLPFETVTVGTVFSGAGLVAIITLLIRQIGPWRKQASDERDSDFARLRSDISEIKREAREAKEVAQRLENMVACMRPAISILMAEVSRLDPNNAVNPALVQARELLGMAATGDFGVVHGLVGLATTKGVNE